ncbi:MAG: hypothetical protein Kow0056_16930 [Coriobacteriia bacterium]
MYADVSKPDVRERYSEMVQAIQDRGLIYPVTIVDGTPMYDGAVSYPAILRAIETKLASA